MRYRTASNGFARSEHRGSVVDLFTEALVEALGAYSGDLRLAGHSLGSQVCGIFMYIRTNPPPAGLCVHTDHKELESSQLTRRAN